MWGFCMPGHGARGPGGCNHVEMIGLEAGIVPWKFHAIASTFPPLKKPLFSPVWHGPPSSWVPFEHSSTKMGSLDIDPVYSTLHPSTTTTRSMSIFTPTCFSTVFQVSSCLTHLLTARTVYQHSISQKWPTECASYSCWAQLYFTASNAANSNVQITELHAVNLQLWD